MPTAIVMPRPGQMTEECTLARWLVTAGAAIRKGDVLFEIETDKSTMEIEAFDAGTLLRIDVAEGETVPVNTVVAWVGTAGEPLPPKGASAAAVPVADAPQPPPPATAVPPTSGPTARRAISPRAARVVAELGIDPSRLTGSGPGGRIVERDVRAAAGGVAPSGPSSVAPSGPSSAAASATAPAGEAEPAPEPMSRMRQVIAARLTESVTTIPQFSVTVPVDMTALVALRTELRREGSPVTVTDLVAHAVAQTLVELPTLNARTDGRLVWRRDRVHLGIAVAVPGGLVVPVIRDAHLRSPAELHDEAARLIAGARAGALRPDELTGSTCTISNLGMLGVESFTAIVNPGEAAILAVGSIAPEVVALGEGMAVRQRMRITLTADHRLVDGELGARFVNAIRRRLEDDAGWRRILPAG